MYKSIILPFAKEDIREAAVWYNNQQKGLGKRFTLEIREKISFISQNPKASNIRYEKVRTAILNVFPFMIHFTVEEESETIIILAVLHTSRSPKIWKNR